MKRYLTLDDYALQYRFLLEFLEIFCIMLNMSFVRKFNLGASVKVLEDSHAFPNGLSHERSGIDIEEDFHFPIKADIRGLRGKIISDWGINTGGIIIETKVEGRKATFLIPREIVAPV